MLTTFNLQDLVSWCLILVAYTTGDGAWRSTELAQTPDRAWQGTIPVSDDLAFFVQAVNMAGNVAVDDNNGLYYGACALIGDVSSDTAGLPDGAINIYDIQVFAAQWGRHETDLT